MHQGVGVGENLVGVALQGRPELLDVKPDWAGGKLNATSILLEPLAEGEVEQLVDSLLDAVDLDPDARRRIVTTAEGNPLFLEVKVDDSSEFTEELTVRGVHRHGFGVLEVKASSVPTAIAAVLLAIRDQRHVMPHVYFRWTEGAPVRNFVRFVFLGQGEIAPLTREVLREAEPDVTRRPWVHVS